MCGACAERQHGLLVPLTPTWEIDAVRRARLPCTAACLLITHPQMAGCLLCSIHGWQAARQCRLQVPALLARVRAWHPADT